jgi:type IV pilus assembly protein PilW
MLDILNNRKAFTLVELLVALVVVGVVMAAIVSTYYSQQKSYVAQEQVAAMQQNLRAAMFYMEREIRMAGCDPKGSANAGIETAAPNSISFTLDIRGDAIEDPPDGDTTDPSENITYSLYTASGIQKLGRNTGGVNQPVAENIDALDFVYLDEDGAPLDDDGSGNVTTSIDQIRSVQITIVARTGRGDPGYKDTKVYYNQQDLVNPILPAQNDSFRRRLLTTSIRCRNLGL